jgi:hypothetical protein
MEPMKQDGKQNLLLAGALFGRFLLSQVVGICTALGVFFLEAGILKCVVGWMASPQQAKAQEILQSGLSTHTWFVGPWLYVCIITASISAGLISQNLFLWYSPRWREAVFNRSRSVPPRNVSEAVGKRWTISCWLLPLSALVSVAWLWWAAQ